MSLRVRLVLPLVALALTGCSESATDIYRDVLQAKADVVDAMWKVTDEKSASEIVPRVLKAYQERNEEFEKRWKTWQDQTQIEKVYEEVIERDNAKVQEATAADEGFKKLFDSKPVMRETFRDYLKARHWFLKNKLPFEHRLQRERERMFRMAELITARQMDAWLQSGNKNPRVTLSGCAPELMKAIASIDSMYDINLRMRNEGKVALLAGWSEFMIDTSTLATQWPKVSIPGFPDLPSRMYTQDIGPPGWQMVRVFAYRGQMPRDVGEVELLPLHEVGLDQWNDNDGLSSPGRLREIKICHASHARAKQPIEVMSDASGRIQYLRWVGYASVVMTLPPPETMNENEQLPAPTTRRDVDIYLGYKVPLMID